MKQKQSLPLEQKLILTKQRIDEWYNYWDGQVYISFSGGKDSTVLSHIIKTMFPDVPAVFVDTGLEYPEIRSFAIDNADVVLHPKKTFPQVLQHYGYPIISKEQAKYIREYRTTKSEKLKKKRWGVGGTCNSYKIFEKWKFLTKVNFKISDQCCDVMKKNPIKSYENKSGRKGFLGNMADESSLRMSNWIKYGCNAFQLKRPVSTPLSIWKESDILKYLFVNKIPYASLYGEIQEIENNEYCLTGLERTGCVFCGFGCHLDEHPNRFEKLKLTHPKLYAYCINGGEYVDGIWQPSKEGLGMGKVLDTIGVKY